MTDFPVLKVGHLESGFIRQHANSHERGRHLGTILDAKMTFKANTEFRKPTRDIFQVLP